MKAAVNLRLRTFLIVSIVSIAWHQTVCAQATNPSTQQPEQQQSPITVPSRPANPVYKGEHPKPRPEIEFTPSNRMVNIKLLVQDPNGYFIPRIRPENFAVYENGVRQKIANVDIEHSPVSIALLMEAGGRYHELNKVLGLEVPQAGRELLNVLNQDDKIAVFRYQEKLETVADFNQGRQVLDTAFNQLSTPPPSEANFYDALIQVLDRMREVSGRKAIVIISSGVDTFSKTNFQHVLQMAQDSGTPIYSLGLAHYMKREAAAYGANAPFARLDWNSAEKQLETLAHATGGRAYVPESDVEIPAIYDDIMENLRVRYVVTYVSSNPTISGPPRHIRVELINPQTGQPLTIRDSNSKPVAAKVFIQEAYSAAAASGG
jgi:VWFA-related protein